MTQDEQIAALRTEVWKQRGQVYAAMGLLRLLTQTYKPELFADLKKPDVRHRLRYGLISAAYQDVDNAEFKLAIAKGVDEFFDLLTMDTPSMPLPTDIPATWRTYFNE
ncbi:MAG: hypothetical protein OXR64_00975 [Chloroflexota bacterium]|nr:hypothetical protein [Chloroflexota bacterium]MDE2918401.1 hypothetical protein [Chloroflexota bacterium]